MTQHIVTIAGAASLQAAETHLMTALQAAGAELDAEPIPLSQAPHARGAALEARAVSGDPHALRAALARILNDGAPLDWCVQPAEDARVKRLLVCDMDSTIIGCECIDELADLAGVKDRVAAVTEQAMRGELDFAASLTARVALLAGAPASLIRRAYAERVRLNRGARALLATMSSAGAHCLLVSGGFTVFTEPVAADAGFHGHASNTLEIEDGRLTGRVRAPILDRAGKAARLLAAAKERGMEPSDALAVGDGANDLDMMACAGLSVAYRAKPAVAAAAMAAINTGDLRSVLRFQGFTDAEIIEPE